jgi:hypothetical protein
VASYPYPLSTYVRPADAQLPANIVTEPRLYFATLTFPGDTETTVVQADPATFRNGEGFPVVMTHVIAVMREQEPEVVPTIPPLGDERMIQRYAMRFERLGEYYQNADPQVIPLWATDCVSAGDAVTQGSSSWTFPQPLVLSNEDLLLVEVVQETLAAIAPTRIISAAFHGYGMVTKQPYTLVGSITVDDFSVHRIETDALSNYGIEPLIIERMTLVVGSSNNQSDPTGNIRAARVNVRRIGSGTGAWWAKSSLGPSHAPAQLYGVTTGRSVVHCLPEGGWQLEPNQGVTLEVSIPPGYGATRREQVLVALAGYALVPSEVAR